MTAESGTRPSDRWKAERHRIDLAGVVTSKLGLGERKGRRIFWRCPFHDDHTPSFGVDPQKQAWSCYPCQALTPDRGRGDAVSFIMQLDGLRFGEAVAYLLDGRTPEGQPRPAPPPAAAPKRPETSNLEIQTPEGAEEYYNAAHGRLTGSTAETYLWSRGLDTETVVDAKLGCEPRGVVIPWFAGDRITLLKVRRLDGLRPKYLEVYRDKVNHTGLYPGPEAIVVGRPLVITEGEFDCLLLDQRIGDVASVVTLGSASGRLDSRIMAAMLKAPKWFIATDADQAGDKAAEGWPVRAVRVRPPVGQKDWTDAAKAGVQLRSWWLMVLAGREPTLWDALRSEDSIDAPGLAARAEARAWIESQRQRIATLGDHTCP